MLKKTFLFFFVLFSIKSLTVNAQNPSIGFILQDQLYDSDPLFGSGYRALHVSIKNTGDEVLNNINILDPNFLIYSYSNCVNNGTSFTCTDLSLETLNPDDVITMTLQIQAYNECEQQNQFEVTAETPNGTQISDFSDDNSYYYNSYTYVFTGYENTTFGISETYIDLNTNGIVDVGDVIEYNLYSSIQYGGNVYPNFSFDIHPINLYNNEVVTVSNISNTIGDNVTITYPLNAADVAIGYVYYKPDIDYQPYSYCGFYEIYQSSACFNCPTPNNCNNCIKTNLSGLLPNTISGQVTFDVNNDNCTIGLNLPNRRVNATTSGATHTSFTNQFGDYSIYIPNINTYTTSAGIDLNPEFTSNPTNYSITSSGSGQIYDADFCVSSTNGYTDLKILIVPKDSAVPGFNSSYLIYAYNQGSTALNGSLTLTYNDTQAILFEQSPASNSSTANSLTWNFSNLIPFQRETFFVGFTISQPPIVESDDIVIFTATSTQDVADSNLINNQYTLNQIAVNSFDPNDKTILEGPYITQEQSDGYLHFLTRFQNEGTAPAMKVIITETLNSLIEYSTFEPIASSHPAHIQIQGSNQLKYTFENINLPHAAADEPASHGWMLYKAKLKSWFSNYNIVKSKSNIYFDFNPAIITNEATSQIGALSTNEFSKNNFKLFPNPATNQINITSINNEHYNLSIIDINGKQVYNDKFTGNKTVDISSLSSGFFIVRISNAKGQQNFKLIKK